MEEARKNKAGLKAGQTNNPNGRPKGSKNKVSGEIKEKIASYLENNFETFESDLKKLSCKPHLRAKLYLETAKLIIPPPRDKEEDEKDREAINGLLNRIFPPEK